MLTVDSIKIINFLKKNKINRISTVKNIYTPFHKKYLGLQKKKVILVKEQSQRNEVFLNNIDTCKRTSYKQKYRLSVDLVLSFLYKNHIDIIMKMINLHRYTEKKKKIILEFLSNLEKYDKEYIIEWINKNGIELMRSLYIFILNGRMPPEVHKIIGEEIDIYGEFTSLDIQEEIELNLGEKEIRNYKCDGSNLNLIINSRKKPEISMNFIKRCFYLNQFLDLKKDINLKIWMSKIKKKLPKKRGDQYLGPKEVNTGCSSRYEISLWRKEEISKVLIHEIFHHLELERINDISVLQEFVYQNFDIQRNMRINFFESYTELWANIINIFYIHFTKLKRTKKKSLNNSSLIEMLNLELTFSVFQCAKVLNFYGYKKFEDFNNKNENKSNRFIQKSNIFSYYVGRSLLFYNFDKFIELCLKYNENIVGYNIPANEIFNLINDTLINTDYKKKVNNFIKILNSRNLGLVGKTLRFSAIEQKYGF